MILRNCRFVITQDPERRVLEHYDILVEGNAIAALGKGLEAGRGDDSIDCSGKIVMPGMVNTHAHLGMHSLRGAEDSEELFKWLSSLEAKEKGLSPAMVRENTLAGIREAVRFGTTTIYDSYKFPEERLEAFRKGGVRGLLSSTVTDDKSFAEARKFLESMPAGGIVEGAVAANAVYSTGEETILKVVDYSEEKGLLRRIHVGETRKDRFDTLKKRGKLAVEYLDSLGFLGEKALLVHCIWVTKGEIRKIATAGAKVSHNPVSNMKLASGGVMPLNEMLAEGVVAGLGTDSVASNNNLDVFEEMKVCALLHRHHKWDPKAVSAQQVLDMATFNGAKCLGLEKLGKIKEGFLADIITLNMDENLVPTNDIVSNIVFSAQGMNVSDTIVDGKPLMLDRQLQ